ncbi:MAG: GNAT family N-acetyltransferase [Pseudomonadota bacterium]
MQIETERLVIRSLCEDDIDSYHRIVRDSRVTRYLGDGAPHSRDVASAYILDCIERESSGKLTRYAVVWKQSSELIGFSGFKRLSAIVDFGYRFAFSCWGKGIATEAGHHILQYGRNELALSEITARVVPGNVASTKVLQKLDFQSWDGPSISDDGFQWFLLTL